MKVKRGRPSSDHAERQREIADVVLKVIETHGFDKASMRLIAREANCTTGVLSHYFPCKEDLMLYAVDMLFDKTDQNIDAAIKFDDPLEAVEYIVSGGDAADWSFDFWSVWLPVLAKARHDSRLARKVNKRHGRFRDRLTQVIKAGQEKNQIRTDIEAALLSDHINAISDGLGLMGPFEKKRLSKKRIAELIKISVANLKPQQ